MPVKLVEHGLHALYLALTAALHAWLISCLAATNYSCLQGPLENLLEHIDDPFGNNGLTLETASKFTPGN